MELHQQLAELRNVQALPAWLITVTRRRCYAMLRIGHPFEPLNDHLSDSSDRVGRIEREHTIERAVQQLPGRCRQLINLLYLDANAPSYGEIAKEMGRWECPHAPSAFSRADVGVLLCFTFDIGFGCISCLVISTKVQQ